MQKAPVENKGVCTVNCLQMAHFEQKLLTFLLIIFHFFLCFSKIPLTFSSTFLATYNGQHERMWPVATCSGRWPMLQNQSPWADMAAGH